MLENNLIYNNEDMYLEYETEVAKLILTIIDCEKEVNLISFLFI